MRSLAKVALLLLAFAVRNAVIALEQPANDEPMLRIAVVDIGFLFTKYERSIDAKKTIEEMIEPLKEEAKQIDKRMKGLKADLADKNTPRELADYCKEQLKECLAQLEGLDKTARDKIGKVQSDQLKDIWVEVNRAIATRAKALDLDVVFAYGDPVGAKDTLPIVTRKLGALDTGIASQVFARDGADITSDVLTELNRAYRARKKSAAKTVAPSK